MAGGKRKQLKELTKLLADRNEDLREENEELMRKLIAAYEALLEGRDKP